MGLCRRVGPSLAQSAGCETGASIHTLSRLKNEVVAFKQVTLSKMPSYVTLCQNMWVEVLSHITIAEGFSPENQISIIPFVSTSRFLKVPHTHRYLGDVNSAERLLKLNKRRYAESFIMYLLITLVLFRV